MSATRFVLVFALALAGCRSASTVVPASDLRFSVMATPSAGDPAHAIAIEAKAINANSGSWTRGEGCGFWGEGMHLAIVTPSGETGSVWNPLDRPACPDFVVPFPSGDIARAHADFGGTLYSTDGAPIALAAGEYTVIATFVVSRGDEFRTLESRAQFTWTP